MRRFSCFILVAVIYLSLLFPMAASAAWQPGLSVGLQTGQGSIKVKLPCRSQLFLDGQKKAHSDYPAGTSLEISHSGEYFLLGGRKIKAKELLFKAFPKEEKNFHFLAAQQDYRGEAKVILSHGRLTLVNVVNTEDYLQGVVAKEMPSDWPEEALKAQAVAARTYALKNRKRHAAEGFDLCSSTHCQQYLGIGSETARASKAVASTAGEVLLYRGKLIEAFFHTDSGGMTENSEDVWGEKLPYLRAAEEADMHTQPWKKNFDAQHIAALVSRHSRKEIGTLKKIELSPLKIGKSAKDRTASGRVKQAVFVGSKGKAAVSGNDLRSLLGLRSTLFGLSLKNKEVIAEGYGWGHGLGLSQWGARKWAEKKKDYKDILHHYYQHSELKKLY